MAGRRSTLFDLGRLQAFCCSSAERPWEAEVEEAVHSGFAWQSERSDRDVRLFFSDAELAVVIGFEDADPYDAEAGIFLAFVAVEKQFQGREFGPTAVDDLMPELRERALGGLISARVDPRNCHSKRALTKLGFAQLTLESDYELWRAH